MSVWKNLNYQQGKCFGHRCLDTNISTVVGWVWVPSVSCGAQVHPTAPDIFVSRMFVHSTALPTNTQKPKFPIFLHNPWSKYLDCELYTFQIATLEIPDKKDNILHSHSMRWSTMEWFCLKELSTSKVGENFWPCMLTLLDRIFDLHVPNTKTIPPNLYIHGTKSRHDNGK